MEQKKEVSALIRKLKNIASGNDRKTKRKAESVLYRIGRKFANPGLQSMTPKNVKTFYGVLLEMMESKNANRECAAAAAFMSYLAGDEKAFLEAIKKTPLNKKYNYYSKVKQLLDNFKNYSIKNKISPCGFRKNDIQLS